MELEKVRGEYDECKEDYEYTMKLLTEKTQDFYTSETKHKKTKVELVLQE